MAEDLSFGELAKGVYGDVEQNIKNRQHCFDVRVTDAERTRRFVLISKEYRERKYH